MANDGVWTLTDEGEWVLAPHIEELKTLAMAEATNGWATALILFLASHSQYTPDELKDSLLERNERGDDPHDTVSEFIIEALTGDL